MERTTATKIQTQHGLLQSQLSGVLRAMEGGESPVASAGVERLARTLELHLTLEEEHYFPENRSAEPHLEGEIDDLLSEHAVLRRALCEAAELLHGGDGSGALEVLKRYAKVFHQHEKREYALLEDSSHG